MKKLTLTLFLALSIAISFSQDSTYTKVYHNEFGMDGTSFVKQFLNFNSGEYSSYYLPVYYLTYRRKFKFGNIRSAIGGSYSDYDRNPAFEDDNNKYHYNSYSLSSRIGWEFYSNLNTRWQVYYGLDFKYMISYTKNDTPYWNGGYANGIESKTNIYAIAPLLGFRLMLNKRLSLSTETSFSLNWQDDYVRKYFIPVTDQYPSLPDEISPKTKKVLTSFSQPVSLFVTFYF